MRTLLDACGGDTSGLTVVADRPSTVKMRFMAGNHPLLRTDYEKASPLPAESEAHLIAQIENACASCGAVIVSDYGKGVVTPAVFKAVVAAAQKKGIPVFVDPKGKDFTIYKGADAITPNAKELAEATNMPTGSDDEVIAAARALIRETGIATIIAKRSEKGMSVVTDKDIHHYPATAATVAGVAGAGDTVIATLAAARAAGIVMEDAAAIANQAAGVIVAKPGTTPITRAELQAVLAGADNPLRDTTREAFIYHDWMPRGRLSMHGKRKA
jgi:D-beta-D-heptose 7-phosphate kinase/D-beta-D-heptose 1-phosphate adenosyltransferase